MILQSMCRKIDAKQTSCKQLFEFIHFFSYLPMYSIRDVSHQTLPLLMQRMSDNSEKCSVATQTNGVDLEVQITFLRERAVDCEKQNEQLRNLVKDKDTEIRQLIEDNGYLKTKLEDVKSKYGKALFSILHQVYREFLKKPVFIRWHKIRKIGVADCNQDLIMTWMS